MPGKFLKDTYWNKRYRERLYWVLSPLLCNTFASTLHVPLISSFTRLFSRHQWCINLTIGSALINTHTHTTPSIILHYEYKFEWFLLHPFLSKQQHFPCSVTLHIFTAWSLGKVNLELDAILHKRTSIYIVFVFEWQLTISINYKTINIADVECKIRTLMALTLIYAVIWCIINCTERSAVKGKAFPIQAWTGPWGSWRLRLQNF
jgi:hypothetical protein